MTTRRRPYTTGARAKTAEKTNDASAHDIQQQHPPNTSAAQPATPTIDSNYYPSPSCAARAYQPTIEACAATLRGLRRTPASNTWFI
mmetsp:Transcript_11681/g.49170  ORF Transcript_11681/g.49170 Transcript_11681/m.49170 type:complete len:87 (+) Transcript_11681:2350-2610(+)